jgi:hypothetical protein
LPVLTGERVRVTFQTLPAYIGIPAAVVAPEAPRLGAYLPAEGRATHRAHAERGQRAASCRLDHVAATGLISNIAGEIVKPISVHAFLPN